MGIAEGGDAGLDTDEAGGIARGKFGREGAGVAGLDRREEIAGGDSALLL